MKRYILTALMSLVLFSVSVFATEQIKQPNVKSEAEKYMQKVAKIKSDEINYAYISASMFRQMFGMMGAEVELHGSLVSNPLESIRSMRQFVSTGDDGFRLLSKAMEPFLQEDETVMGMQLIALNRDDGALRVIYGDPKNLLVININDDDMLVVVFIAGITYDAFRTMDGNQFNFVFYNTNIIHICFFHYSF